jgi:hypothetical protein
MTILQGDPDKSGNSAPYLPDATGLSNADAAEEYAKAGCHILPTRPDDIKNPGSFAGKGWPQAATDDLEAVRSWWRRWPKAGIALHPGPSGFLVIDVDHPEYVPQWLWELLDTALFRPTDEIDPQHGHYFFSLHQGQRFGCGLGKLKPPKGEKKWGEVKCFGGVIILGPTNHPREGGRYVCAPGGNPPPVPNEIAENLSEAPEPERTAC